VVVLGLPLLFKVVCSAIFEVFDALHGGLRVSGGLF